jgi:hypothetical protein
MIGRDYSEVNPVTVFPAFETTIDCATDTYRLEEPHPTLLLSAMPFKGAVLLAD